MCCSDSTSFSRDLYNHQWKHLRDGTGRSSLDLAELEELVMVSSTEISNLQTQLITLKANHQREKEIYLDLLAAMRRHQVQPEEPDQYPALNPSQFLSVEFEEEDWADTGLDYQPPPTDYNLRHQD